MDRWAPREIQAPLKARYRDEPGSAITALEASRTFDGDGITCTVRSWAGPVGARNLRLEVWLDTDADDESLARLTAATERYCVVAQSLVERPTLTIRRATGPH